MNNNNDIVVAIEKLIEERFDEGNYICQHDYNEVSLEDAVSEILAKFDIQFSVENMCLFESPGYDTGVVVVAWIYDGTLDTYNIQWESM